MPELTEEQIDHYRTQGYTLVPKVLSPESLQPLKDHISKHVDQLATRLYANRKIEDLHIDKPFGYRLAALYKGRDMGLRSWDDIVFSQELYDLITHPNLLAILPRLIGNEISFHGDYHLRPKLPRSKLTSFPWHQDSQYYGAPTEDMHVVSIWIPLIDVNRKNGCLWMIPQSHTWGLLDGKRGADMNMRTAENVEERGTPVPVPMNQGDVLLFHNLTFHTSKLNHTEQVRWSLDIRYSATPESRPMAESERLATEFMYNKLRESGRTPLRVLGKNPLPTWADWTKEAESKGVTA